MKNDFFKYILLSSGLRQNRTELETETLPYTFNSNSYKLRNYRIYGNTVNGESVGDRTRNLFDIEHPEIKRFDIEKVSFGVYTAKSDRAYYANRYRLNTETGKTYRLTGKISNNKLVQLSGILPGTITPENGEIIKSGNISTIFIAQGLTTLSIYSSIADNTLFTVAELQVIEGSTALPYEPYGCRLPVTVTNGTDTETTNLYLPEQIKMVGNKVEYIDFKKQKQHRVSKNLFDYITHTQNTTAGYLLSDNQRINSAGWVITDYIPCDGKNFTINPIGGDATSICLYDENKNFICGKAYLTGGAHIKTSVTITSTQNASYIRFSYNAGGPETQIDNISNIMLNAGSEPLSYEPYIEDTELDVALPALPTFPGTNIISVGTTVQPAKIYLQGNITSFDVSTWENVQKLVRAGLHDKYFTVGDQLVCQKGGSDLTWDIIGFDHDTPTDTQYTHSMTLQLHDYLDIITIFDASEALYYAENGLAAGTYNFTIQSDYDETYGGGKTYQFTLENDVPAGGQLTFNWEYHVQALSVKIVSYSSPTSVTAIEQVAVTEGSDGTNLGTTDGTSANVNYIQRVRFGSNNYGQSPIRQFLNSSAAAGSVWSAQTKFDRPPTWITNTAGFMSDLDSDFLAVIGSAQKVTALTAVDGGGSVTLNDKFFLLSRSEVYGGLENNINEGSPYPYYSDYSDLSVAGTGDDSNRIKYSSGIARWWLLRSPNFTDSQYVDVVDTAGHIKDNGASSMGRIVPACNII